MKYNIGIIGLGLIGGSFAAALSHHTDHVIYGYDINSNSSIYALEQHLITHQLRPEDISKCNIFFIALYPEDTISFIKQHINDFNTNTLLVDLCGVKQYICNTLEPLCQAHNLHFIGAHPMAGKEFSGIHHASFDLFHNASIIFTPFEHTPSTYIKELESICKNIGFTQIVQTTPKYHDEMIALTSQMPHILSNAFIKSPSATQYKGFTGGSFQDFTRVAKLNSKMWSELFMLNQEALLKELDLFTTNLEYYRQALLSEDTDTLIKLLEEGSLIKESLSQD